MDLTYTYVLFQVIITLLATIFYYLHRNLTYWKRLGIPHDPPHIIHGNTPGLRKTRTLHEIYDEYYKKFKKTKAPFCGIYFLQRPTVFVLDMELAKHILIKDFANFTDKGLFHNEHDDPLSAHLFNLDGVKWKILRQKLSSTFTSGKMKFMYPTVVAVAQEFITVMRDLVKEHEILEIRELVARFTTDVIGTCAFGIQCNSLRDPNAEFRQMGKIALSKRRHGNLINGFIQSYPQLARKLHLKRTNEAVHQFFMRIVHETVALREQKDLKRNDFMDILIELKQKGSVTLENGEVIKGITMDEIAAQAFVFFIAGFETSSSTMGFALYELAQHQDVQHKLRTEINEVLQRHQGELSYECMKELHYFDQVISETLRLYTIVPNLNRKALKRYVVPNRPDFIIEEGMSVVIPAAAIHRDPEIYPEPDEFKPERFAREALAARESVTFLSFGDGPRNCIGMRFGQMQTRIGLALLIKNFKFSTCEQTKIPLKFDPKSFLLAVNDGIYLRLEAI